MKIILTLCMIVFIIIPVSFGLRRYSVNQNSIIPYPFKFDKDVYADSDDKSPILIVGDGLGDRLTQFKDRLADKLSINLSKPIKIISITNKGDSIHRSLQKIKQLKQMPLIIIYIGNTDQNYESLFNSTDLRNIEANFKLFNNNLIKTGLMIFPVLSKFLYWPIKYTHLSDLVVKDDKKYSDPIYQLRMKTHYILYESALDEFFNLAKKSNSLIMPITTPLNLDIPPNKSCYGTLTDSADSEVDMLTDLIKKQDFKTAFNLSKDLALINSTNAEILYLHGQVLKKLNRFAQAQKFAEMAIAYDCGNKRGSPIFNVILQKVASKYRYVTFDFHQYLVDESRDNFTFIDDQYPQDFYMENLVDILAQRIKKRLKL